MWFHSLFASWKSRLSRSGRSQPARRGTRLAVEQLEDRALPSGSSIAASVSDLITDINAANAAGGANTITLAAPTTAPYVLTAVNNTTTGSLNYGNTGLPVIAAKDNLTILGNGDTIERSTAMGTPDFRLLRVASGGSLTLENLTLQGGMIEGDGLRNIGFLLYGAGNGGAIYTQGTLVLSGVTVQDNVAIGGTFVEVAAAGGGIFSYSGSVTLEGGTIIQNNEAIGSYPPTSGDGGNAYGGGLFASGGTVTVTNATVDNNTAEGGHSWSGYDSSAYGGGLFAGSYSLDPTSIATVVTLSNATLDGNTATLEGQGDGTLVSVGYVSGAYGGGACLSTLGTGTATLTNCTVQGNSAVGGIDTSRGGGLYILSTATLTNCTVQGNSVEGGPFYNYPPEGGGLFVDGLETKVTLVNDTVQGNSALQFNGYGGYSNYDYGGGIYIAAASTSPSLGYTVYLDSFTVANTINNTDSTGLNGSTANIDGTYVLRNP